MLIDSPSGQIGITGSSKNLIITNGTTADEEVDVNFDELIVSKGGLSIKLFDGDLTLDNTASGANGIDTGSVAVSTWYYIWVIYNPTTRVTAGLLSTSTTYAGLTLPSGYTFAALVGAARTDATSDFLVFKQRMKKCLVARRELLVYGDNESSFTEQSALDFVPIGISHQALCEHHARSTNVTADTLRYHFAADSGGVLGSQEWGIAGDNTSVAPNNYNVSIIDLDDSGSFWHYETTSAGSAYLYVYSTGFILD